MMVNDLGQTFGRSNLFNRDAVGSVNLEQVGGRRTSGRTPSRCIGDLPPSQTGTLENPQISEAGRKFLSDLLMRLSDAQLRDLFDVARFAERAESSNRPGDDRGVGQRLQEEEGRDRERDLPLVDADAGSEGPALLDERAGAQLADRLAQLLLGVHDDRSVPGDRLLERLAGHQQEADAFVARLHHDLVAAVEQHERPVAGLVARARVSLPSVASVRTPRGSDASRNVPAPAKT